MFSSLRYSTTRHVRSTISKPLFKQQNPIQQFSHQSYSPNINSTFYPHRIPFIQQSNLSTRTIFTSNFQPKQYHKQPSQLTLHTQRRYNSKKSYDDAHEYVEGEIEHERENIARGLQPDLDNEVYKGRGKFAEQIEAENYRNFGGRNQVPQELRGPGNVFRRGLDVPRINPNHWFNRFILEPYIALKGHFYVHMDTIVRLTPFGWLSLHFGSFLIACCLLYYLPNIMWNDFEAQMDHARHLYMIDVARLLWLQQGIKNCELIITQRQDGEIPTTLLPDVIQSQREKPFQQYFQHNNNNNNNNINTFNDKYKHDIYNKIQQQKYTDEMKKEELYAQMRYDIWGDKTPLEYEEEKQRQIRLQQLYQDKSNKRYEYNQQIQSTKDEIQINIQQQKNEFRNKYIQPYIQLDQ